MAVRQGYGKIATKGLVFAYDTGDTVNSYKGEPTVNNIPSQKYSIELSRAVQHVSASWSESEQAWYVTLPSGSETYYRGIRLLYSLTSPYAVYEPTGSNVAFSYNIQALSDGLWNFTDFNNRAATGSQSYGNDNRSSTIATGNRALVKGEVYKIEGLYVTQANDPLVTGSLYQCYNTMCLAPANETNTSFVNGGAISEAKTVKIWNIQHELKDHATQFTAGTRTNTDSLVDLTGNSTLDLTNVSFDSNAQITFDGTDDQTTHDSVQFLSSSSWTMSQVQSIDANANTSWQAFSGEDRYVVGNSTNYGGYFMWHTSGLFWWYQSFDNPVYYGVIGETLSGGNIFDRMAGNGYFTVDVTYNGTTNVMKVYINGIEEASASPTWAPGLDRITFKKVGGGNNRRFTGEIPIQKLYTQALTADEVRNNYRHYKNRFNI